MSQHNQDNTNASLVVVGSGIKFMSHLTTEAKTYIEQSDKVLYLVNDPAMQEWIQSANPNAESLDEIYARYPLRLHCYRAITNYILEVLHQKQHVCVVLYGHPAVFAQPALDAVRQAQKEGYYAKILPGISAEDCLFADLLIDPGSCGCQSYEATDFLIHRRQVEPASHLVLWQVGVIGVLGYAKSPDNTKGAALLRDYLSGYYPREHQVILYEAAQYPHLEPRIDKFPLEKLPEAKFTGISTLYVPPAFQTPYDKEILTALGIDVADLQ
jgi:tetrapyrrole methylase family protein/MazG family protein